MGHEAREQQNAGQGQKNELMDAEFISHERLYISQIVI